MVGECWLGHQGFLSGWQTVITGAAELCHEATALKRSSVVFHACRNQFDCRADLNLGNALGLNFVEHHVCVKAQRDLGQNPILCI